MFALNLSHKNPIYTISKSWWIFIFVALVATSIPWSLKTSGVLEMTTEWSCYPWGYKYIIQNYDNWPVNKENTFYILQHQAFQGIDEAYVARNSGFELHRSLYAALSTGLWFLGPLLSLWVLNIFFWALAVYSMVYTVARLGGGKVEQYTAAFLTLFGQGFVYSVGEFSPHIIGYGSMYYIYAFAAYHRIWDKKTKWQEYGQVYALIGLLQMAYNSAWLSLVAVGGLSLYRVFHSSNRLKEFLTLCSVGMLAIIPYTIMLLSTKMTLDTKGVIAYSGSSLFQITSFFKQYLLVYAEGLIGMGPLLVIFSCTGLFYALVRKQWVIASLVVISLLQIGICGVFMLNAGGRGYVTFTCSASFVLVSVYGLSQLWSSRVKLARLAVITGLLLFPLFSHIPKITSMRLPLMGFYTGYLHHLQQNKWQKYDAHLIP